MASSPPIAPPRRPDFALQVDGTLVNSKQQLTPGVEAAVQRAHAAGVPVRAAQTAAIAARPPWLGPRGGRAMTVPAWFADCDVNQIVPLKITWQQHGSACVQYRIFSSA
jgi:hypothetical protein